jgi:aldehyde dehydrogenase (NAD+)
MASEGEKTIFDVEAASTLVNELKSAYAAGKSRSYEWRISQVQCILKMVEHHEQDILDAVFSDLSKPAFEVSFFEVLSLSLSLSLSLTCACFRAWFLHIYIYIYIYI